MELPLSKKLRKRLHLEMAVLQDEIVELLYTLCRGKEPVLHGGTALWRCYQGNRFSEDLDFYGEADEKFREAFEAELTSREFALGKYKHAPNVIFIKVTNGITEVKLEITTRKPKKKILGKYEKADGGFMDVYTLSPEDLIQEKMEAYKGRRFIRDIYDVYFLSSHIEGSIPGLAEFIDSIALPVDEKNLKVIVYTGVVPSFREMVEALKRRSR